MRIFKNKPFARFARQANLDDVTLHKAVGDAERGLIGANLGGGVIKQRIARPGKGKSGGFRALILYRQGALAFFVHGYAKNARDNIEDDELAALKELASELLSYDAKSLAKAAASGALIEVKCDDTERKIS